MRKPSFRAPVCMAFFLTACPVACQEANAPSPNGLGDATELLAEDGGAGDGTIPMDTDGGDGTGDQGDYRSPGDDRGAPGDGAGPFLVAWTHIDPSVGFVSSVTFHPSVQDEVWASGDDGAGLYRSTDGGTSWTLLTTPPPNQSTYSLLIDPSAPSRIYAPNHFGRGFLASSDAGASWQWGGMGLPTSGDERRVNDLAVEPSSPGTLFICTDGGLYRSTDYGATFGRVTSAAFAANAEVNFRAVVTNDFHIVVGAASGRVYHSANKGAFWTELTTDGFVPVSDLALTNNGLYVAFESGHGTRTTTFVPGDFILFNDAWSVGGIDTGLFSSVVAVSGSTVDTDTVYFGTTAGFGADNWGFFVSTNGGGTFSERSPSPTAVSVFAIAVNPNDASHLVLGTVGSGILVTTDAGATWNTSPGTIFATDSLGFAEDPQNPDHLMFSSTEGVTGTPGVFETSNGGASWTEVSTLLEDAHALDISPISAMVGLAGTFYHAAAPGIYRTTGDGWTLVQAATANIDRFVRSPHNAATVWALAPVAPTAPSESGIYVSTDDGLTWVHRSNPLAGDVAWNPAAGHADEVVAAGLDVFATTDAFVTTLASLGLANYAPPHASRFFTSVAFDPGMPTRLVVGSSLGEVFVSDSYEPTGAGVVWRTVANPAIDVQLRSVLIDTATPSSWFVAAWTGDSQVTNASTPGVMRTTDQGATWEWMHKGMYPSRLVWQLHASKVPRRIYAGTWGGGLLRLDY